MRRFELRIPDDWIAAIDAVSGTQSRADFTRDVLRDELERRGYRLSEPTPHGGDRTNAKRADGADKE